MCVQYTHKLCVFRSHVQIQDMYFAKPPVAPDLEFYREVFQTLIKFNDRYVSGHLLFCIVCTHVHICVYCRPYCINRSSLCTHMYVCFNTHTYVCMFVCTDMYVRMFVCADMYVCLYTHTYACTV